ncbi:hypothetical protein BZARG_1192 [Bizionia argentinensis JUB59]|uniref:Uncharacterized protein n=1 Tax=Bizionia argentinensis JUB59 TaxID=1046627 RepID=G2ECS3_9FLAO|nr:hypothetical protein [Bizionia argentinensis]EGV43723.2 hypothetical protein BZARG_1192 [Bizionia argentinensis JUB59]
MEQLFHAEFSSILLRNYKDQFNELAWINSNSYKFKYGNDGASTIKEQKASQHFFHKWNNQGFLNEYATSSLENDFNSFAKNIFTPKPRFDKLIEEYSALANKNRLIIEFYNAIHDDFTKVYFKDILNYDEVKTK